MLRDRRKRILIHVDNRLRDLPGCALLKYTLEHRYGHRVELYNRRPDRNQIWEFRPHLMVMAHLFRPRWVQLARYARRAGAAIVILTPEGWLDSDHLRSRYERSGTPPQPDLVDLFFVHNRAQVRQALEVGIAHPGRVIPSGIPRFDHYFRPGLRRYFSKERVSGWLGIPADGPLAVWTTMFAWAALGDAGTDDDFLAPGREPSTYQVPRDWRANPDFARRTIGDQARERYNALEWIKRLIREIPNLNLIIKTHPAEPADIYRRWLRFHRIDAGRVKVVENQYIQPLLMAADLHLHQHCITATESWMLGKPTLLLPFRFTGLPRDEELLDLSETYEDFESFLERARYYLGGGAPPADSLARRARYLRKKWSGMDGSAAARIAQEIDRYLADPRNGTLARRADWRLRANHAYATVRGLGRALLGRPAPLLARLDRTPDERRDDDKGKRRGWRRWRRTSVQDVATWMEYIRNGAAGGDE